VIIKETSKFYKILSTLLAVAIVIGSFPVYGIVSYAAEETFAIQYLENGVVQKDTDIELKPDLNSDEKLTGKTDEKGVWETSLVWSDLAETIRVSIKGSSKEIQKPETESKYLIIDIGEESWSDNLVDLSSVEISADNTDVYKGGEFTLSSTVEGTALSYQWYLNGSEISGATSDTYKVDFADESDDGNYYCRVEGPSTTLNSQSVYVGVSEKELSDVKLKAYANENEISGTVNRGEVKEIKLKVEGIPDDAKISAIKFYINDECVSSTNKEPEYVFPVKSGVETYECKVVLTFDEKYQETILTLPEAIKLEMMTQSVITAEVSEEAVYDSEAEEYNITYSPNPKAAFDVTLSGGEGSGDYILSVTDERNANGTSVALIGSIATCTRYAGENKWKITIKGAGSFNIVAGKNGDGDYVAAENVTLKVNVAKASAEGFAFQVAEPEAVVYNENNNEFTNIIDGEFEDVKYSVESGDCAVVDENTGKLTISKAGTVVVKATMAESKNYTEMTATYTLTVNKATQTVKFEDMAEKIFYGQSYARTAAPVLVEGVADGFGYNSEAQVKYSVVLPEGETEAIAQVNEDGTLVFANGKTGTVTIKAELEGNDCYETAETSYVLEVEEYAVENAVIINGEKTSADNEWYIGDVSLIPAEGHKISKSNSLDSSNIWLDEIVISTEGTENGCDVYVKNIETGAISKVSTIENEKVQIDKSAPESLEIKYKTQAWYEAVIDAATFGYYNSNVVFVLEAKDSGSGVKSFIWKFTSSEEGGASVDETEVAATLADDVYRSEDCSLGDENDLKEYRGKLSFEAIDNAGNKEEYDSEYIIVIDNTDPEISITTDTHPSATVNGIYPFDNADESTATPIEIFNNDVTVNFSIVEKNFFADRVIVTVNGENVTDELSWAEAGDNHLASMSFTENGDYSIVVSYMSIFGEKAELIEEKTLYSETKNISVDKEAATVSVNLSEAGFDNGTEKYYSDDVVAEIEIDEEKFRPSEITVSAIEGYKSLNEEQISHLSNSSSWTKDENSGKYVASIRFESQDADGEYGFAVGYTDLAGNVSEEAVSGIFVIDTTAPEVNVSNDNEAVITVDGSYPFNDADSDCENPVEIYADNTSAIFEIKEKNFFVNRAVVTVNGENVSDQLTWETADDKHTAIIPFESDGDYEIEIAYTDIFDDAENSGDKAVYSVSKKFAVDKEAPVIVINLSEPQNSDTENKYYNSDVKAEIIVKDAKFRPFELVVSDMEGFKGVSGEDKAYLGMAESWTYSAEKGGYTASITFEATAEGGNYAFAVDYTDLAGNVATQTVSDSFVIDINKPVITADYGEASLLDSENNVIASFTTDETNNVTVFDTEEVVVTFSINEYNFNSENVVVYIAKDGGDFAENNFDGDWISNEGTHTNTVTINGKGTYKIKVTCKDLCTNVADEFISPKIIIDDTPPRISYSINAEGTGYYDDDQLEIAIQIFDDRFNAERVSLEIEAKDIEEKQIELTEAIPEISDNNNWIEEQNDAGEKYHRFTLTLTTEAKYKLNTIYEDATGEESSLSEDFVLDRTGPENLRVEYSESLLDVILSTVTFNFYNAPVKITLVAEDNISGVKQLDWEYTKEEGASEINVESLKKSHVFDTAVKEGIHEFSLPGVIGDTVMLSDIDQFRGSISFKATDMTGNSTDYGDMEDIKENVIVIDTISPTREVTYSAAARVYEDISYYNSAAIATISITEANFYSEVIHVMVNGVENAVSWTQSGDIWTGEIVLSETGDYVISINYTDRSSNQMVEYVSNKIVIDNTDPVVDVTYSPDKAGLVLDGRTYYPENQTATIRITEHNFDKDGIVVSVTATDANGNTIQAAVDSVKEQVQNLNWTTEGDIHTATIAYTVDANYTFDIQYTDYADRTAADYKADIFTVDKVAPAVSYKVEEYKTKEEHKDKDGNIYKTEVLSEKPVKVSVTASDDISPIHSIAYNYTNAENNKKYNYTVANEVSGSDGKMSNKMEIEFYVPDTTSQNIEFEGQVNFSVGDYATNNSGEKTTKEIIIVDNVSPVLSSEFGDVINKEELKNNELPVVGYGVKFKVREANFDASKLKLETIITDIGGNPVEFKDENTFITYFQTQSNWKTDDNLNYEITLRNLKLSSDGIEATLPDGRYIMKIEGFDRVGNVAKSQRITGETTETVEGLETGRFLIDTESPINLSIKYSTPKLQKILSAITFNYYNAPVVVTLFASDSTSGVKRFEWTYTKESGASDTNVSTYNGFFEFSNSEIEVDPADPNREVSVDITIPESKGSREHFRGNISFKAIDRGNNESEIFTDKKNVLVVDRVAPEGTVTFSDPKSGSWEEGNTAYYDSDATATILINEVNFYPEDVVLKVNDEPYENVTWIKSGKDQWTGTVEFTEDGEYVLSISYADRSTNVMKEYVSGEIVVDEYAPVIEVTYSPDGEAYTSSEGVKYHSEDQTATIKITEHNFDPKGVDPTLTATDINGKELSVSDLVSHLKTDSAWKSDGDEHTATIVYSKDANYVFDIKCTDSADNVGELEGEHKLSVDKSAPQIVSVDVKDRSVLTEENTEYYNDTVTVSVSAEDFTSGVSSFAYSYTDEVTGKTYSGNVKSTSAGGSNASATFKLPTEGGDFRGSIKVTAVDNSGNKSAEHKDKRLIVVDGTVPDGKIELTNKPSPIGGKLYYAGDVTADITIKETNFSGDDVVVTVDGNAANTGNWSNVSDDVWTSTVTVSADGEHKISIDYADKSGNQMEHKESETFVIDHKAPVVVLTGVKNESANNAEKIGFTLRAEDENFVSGGFAPVLTLVKKTEGGFVTENIDLTSAMVSGGGNSITVENLESDGIYSLVCTASDLCGNTTKTMIIADSGNLQVETLKFSINREGSAYFLDKATDKTVKTRFNKDINGNIVINEVNVVPIEEYTVKLNNKVLVENVDYIVNKTGNGIDEWFKNEYVLDAKLFEEEGSYNIIVGSKDSTGSSYYSDMKDMDLSFVVDKTAPSITVSGISKGEVYETDKRKISVMPNDDINELKSLRVIVENNNGETVAVLFEAEGLELQKAFKELNGVLNLEVGEGINQNIKVICEDKAGNLYDSGDNYSGVTVSSNKLVIIVSSTGFKVGAGIVAAVAAGLIILLIIKKKKSKKAA